MHATQFAAMYNPIAPATPAPRCATSGSTRANTPTGANAITQRTSTSIAAQSDLKKAVSGSRVAAGIRTIASASRIENTMSATMSPLAAAAIGFDGMSDVSHRPNV